MNDFYIYIHIRDDNNEIFYVGYGGGNKLEKIKKYYRAYTKSGRTDNKDWKIIKEETTYRVEILYDNLTIEEAKQKEIETIRFFGRKDKGLGTLCNHNDGGNISPYLGRKHSQETKNKISERTKGLKKPKTEEHIRNNSIARYKHINQYDMDGNFIKSWISSKQAFIELNINYRNISSCLYNKRKSAGGFIWKFTKS